MPLLLYKLDRLDVSIDSTRILKEVSFDIRQGEFLGIIGPNGSGKSTLLKAMAGVLPASGGSITLKDGALTSYRGAELARELAVVPQESPVAFNYTVIEIVLMGRSPHLGRFELEREKDLETARKALRRTNLLDLADRRIGELSGGERQRVMIARALAQDTDILFLDEPTAHLDINYQVEILHLARRENTEAGRTVVVVLHDLNLAAEFCDRLIMLRAGEIYAIGTPEEVITAENVQKVYGTAVWVRRHPTSGRPYVLSVGSRSVASRIARGEQSDGSSSLTVHVVCGGGSGGPVFITLLEAGCDVTAGVINIGDTDQESAESLGVEYVEDSPFSPISERAQDANCEFIERADAVVIADTPFGSGNMSNLYSALHAADMGKRVAIIGSTFESRDFAEGEGVKTLNALVERGASVLDSVSELPDWVDKTRGV